jgi:hypothetical protein
MSLLCGNVVTNPPIQACTIFMCHRIKLSIVCVYIYIYIYIYVYIRMHVNRLNVYC